MQVIVFICRLEKRSKMSQEVLKLVLSEGTQILTSTEDRRQPAGCAL
jgi:hypothetical protein